MSIVDALTRVVDTLDGIPVSGHSHRCAMCECVEILNMCIQAIKAEEENNGKSDTKNNK